MQFRPHRRREERAAVSTALRPNVSRCLQSHWRVSSQKSRPGRMPHWYLQSCKHPQCVPWSKEAEHRGSWAIERLAQQVYCVFESYADGASVVLFGSFSASSKFVHSPEKWRSLRSQWRSADRRCLKELLKYLIYFIFDEQISFVLQFFLSLAIIFFLLKANFAWYRRCV